ncbi:penicillin acylase family protein [Myceligenerans salitolerans]|uniref:Penicillin acylase family protein n=1 Tax=Myceligenerans salitolerans TaxID=1230528 RepID=A0ABS3ICA6_9MICO|nr:penicillin acylase family protein [Myceligenerans salitolerans]MBO0610246.1 penicillin acylase family protein [Myceligenerans salitolerans]
MTPPHDRPQTPPFELYRDTHGIPHVRAATEQALAHGQGYVTALDRADQIETGRHRAEARLAARIGPDGLDWDRFAVRVRLADTARRVTRALATPDREWLAAYARGVNAGLAAQGRDHHAWQPWTPIGLFLVDHVLFNGFPAVLWRDHVTRTLAPHFPGVPAGTLAGWFTSDGGPGASSASGSNAWAIAPDATASGTPLLAGDPHRILELPGTYQQIRLACTAEDDDGDDVPYDVLGLAFPGVPGVQHFGYAQTPGRPGGVAWGITNAMAHHVEVFEERFRRGPHGGWEAHGPDGWEPATSGHETIDIRHTGAGPAGPRSESVPWIETPRGVWIATRRDDTTTDTDARHFTIRWPVRVLADAGVPAWRRLLRARTARDIATAFADSWVDPANRVLTADSSGEILSLTAGRIAERAPHERILPLPAWTDAARQRPWTTLPQPTPVTTGVAVDANERPTTPPAATTPGPADNRPDREAHALGWSYAPHRADRIRHLLAHPPADGETPTTQHRIHADVSSGAALTLMTHLGTPEPLRAWAAAGAPMGADSVDAATFTRWRDAIIHHLADDPRLAPLRPAHDTTRTRSPYGAIYAPWFVPEAAIGSGLPHLLDTLDIDPPHPTPHHTTTWGDLHTLAPTTLPGGPPLTHPTPPLAGDNDTVRCTGSTPGVSPHGARGSVARWIWDLADRRGSRWVVPFGASGVPGDPHTADQHETWAAGGTVPVETDWERLEPVDLAPAGTTPPTDHGEKTHGRPD